MTKYYFSSRKEVPEHGHCGYIERRNQYHVPGVTQGIYFYNRVEEVMCCETRSVQILLFMEAGWSTNISSEQP